MTETRDISIPYHALMTAIAAYGSELAAANALGVSEATVRTWLNQTKNLPSSHVEKVEIDTGISRHILRPDLFPVNRVANAGKRARP